jgi:hypothetical protein
MRTISKFGLVALVAALTVLPTLNSPADAQNFFRRSLNRVYAPYGYGNYARSAAVNRQMMYDDQIRQAQAADFTAQVNAMVASGQLTLSEGNAILVRGHF